ncbi:endonuclease SmrB [Alginatibacterium sediminis]|uniref:Ribosome rescue factor SmrB n=2 Tax=Alginatibacterium sediminis TaxID=2164068 RepID=A0A420EGD3_9ALTE|nr:endonuclease SmrB [Alginatibacterium sediminis]RKF19738.1 endonuclease SmrB [Alginatibacterium sediminis]
MSNDPTSQNKFNSFADAMRGIKQIKQDKVSPVPTRIKQKSQQVRNTQANSNNHLHYFSDEYQPLLPDDGPMRWRSPNCDPYELKKLRRGDYAPEIFLDLHGLRQDQAKQELAAMLAECERAHLQVASVMHGYGKNILKKNVPLWLAQHPLVLCFHQASKEYGGDSALFVLLHRSEK